MKKICYFFEDYAIFLLFLLLFVSFLCLFVLLLSTNARLVVNLLMFIMIIVSHAVTI